MLDIGDKIGRYSVTARLGAGGMGQVFRAFDTQLHRDVALKVLLANAEDGAEQAEWTARMIREARAAAAFSHPNAVAVYDVGEHENQPFIVMELVKGRSLRSYVESGEAPLADRIRWLGEMARALGAAHKAGLVHRDIKPDNVMVSDDGIVKILDFGIARRAHGAVDSAAPTEPVRSMALTKSGVIMGTPLYMAPEQIRRDPLDGRVDQFAWGVVAFELLAGRRPWDAPDLYSLFSAMTGDPQVKIRDMRPDVPAFVEAAILRALSKSANDRFASMDDAVAALSGALPTTPTPTPSADRGLGSALWGSLPRRRAEGLAALVVLALAGVGAWMFVSLRSRDSSASGSPSVAAAAPDASSARVAFVAPTAPVAPTQSNVAAPSSAPSTSVDQAFREPPLRHRCESPPANSMCKSPNVPWCDLQEKQIACCAKGLAATGVDGLCECPAGGSTEGPKECPKEAHGAPTAEQVQTTVRASFPAFNLCYEAAIRRAPKTAGRVSVTFELTPEGRVFKAKIAEASLPDPEAQACVLAEFRRLVFRKPTDGYRVVTYPIDFAPGP